MYMVIKAIEIGTFSTFSMRKKIKKKKKLGEKSLKNIWRYDILAWCLFRDEAVSCRPGRRVIIVDQPDNRATDLRHGAEHPRFSVSVYLRTIKEVNQWPTRKSASSSSPMSTT